MPMDIERVIRFLEHPEDAARWFTSLGLEDVRRSCGTWRAWPAPA